MGAEGFGAWRERYREDGVVHIPGALGAEHLRAVEAAWTWMLEHPGPSTYTLYPDEGGTFLQGQGCSAHVPEFQRMLRDTPVGDIAAGLFGSGGVWYLGEQLFLKEGGAARRTPWHQDSAYLSFEGEKLAVVWINLDALPREGCLETIRGSHRGVQYNGSLLDPRDDTLPFYPEGDLPRLPDIESERDKWDIVSWPVEPGDVIVFHTACLHGGGATWPGLRRRTLSLRFFGDDVVGVERPQRPQPPAAQGRSESGRRTPFATGRPGELLWKTEDSLWVRPWGGPPD